MDFFAISHYIWLDFDETIVFFKKAQHFLWFGIFEEVS